MTELLIGCGKNREKRIKLEEIPEFWTDLTTLDIKEDCDAMVIHDLEDLPLPFDDDMFDEIHAYEVLEHTGNQGDWRFFFNQFYEFWRILKPGGYMIGTCPMWDGVWAWSDPGHKRILTKSTFLFLSQKEYKLQVGNTAMADYRDYWDGDFDLCGMQEEDECFGFVMKAVK